MGGPAPQRAQGPTHGCSGQDNEAAAESIHADFDIFYKRYKIKDLDSSVYVDKLQAAVAAYNAGHV